MLRIGLTGGIASGKSTVCQLFSDLHVPVIDADRIARDLVRPNQPAFIEIVDAFSRAIIQADGTLDRPALRHLIFSDPSAKKQLEAILHPKISEQLELKSNQLNTAYCILDIPLLIESRLHTQNKCDRILVIDIDELVQLKRLCLRDKISIEYAQKMITTQYNRYERLYFANDIILNDKPIIQLKNTITELHKKYLQLAYEMIGLRQWG